MQRDTVTLSGAREEVDQLDEFHFPNEQPCIEALSLAIQYQVNFDTHFEDRNAFISGVAKFMEQATVQADLNTLLEEGKEYAILFYTWRSCSRAVPQTDNDKTRKEIYKTVVEILEPYVQKLREFISFQERAIGIFCKEVKRLCHNKQKVDFVSETYLLTLGKLINAFAEMDELKNMKASVRNDFSAYRRAKQFLKDGNSMEESLSLSMNLATQNTMCENLKSQLVTIKGYEELLADIVEISVMMYEEKMYLVPAEKHMLVKVMALTLFLMDTDKGPNIYQMNEKKRINLTKIDHILKQNETVPLYGDMMIAPYNYIKNGPNFDPSKWPCCDSSKSSSQSCHLDNLASIRQRHQEYISVLPLQKKQVALKDLESLQSKEKNKELTELALRGFQLLSEWTQMVMELYSWKLMNPSRPEMNKECPESAEGYERAIRYNFNGQEKFKLIEIIAMIKGLQVVLSRMEPLFMDAIRNHIYSELQEFVQKNLRDPIRRATKRKNDILRIILLSVRDTCVDWLRGLPPQNDPSTKGKKDPLEGFHFKISQRNVGPSSTQLYMVRTMLESLIDERGVKKSRRKEMAEHHVAAIEEFHKKSFYWNYLLHFNESLFNCCDLSQLWFREFFLELTMGKSIQFPIEMSMPWILTDHILETKESSMMEYLLYPLDLYNDSAHCALMTFKKQFLYDEIEAEVNLCFDQFVYKLSDQIFAYYKHLAGCIMLDKKFRSEIIASGETINFPTTNRYETLLKQQCVQLLGRTIDLNQLISSLVNTALQKALDIAISRFEARDVTGIMELDGLIEVNRLAHKMMRKYLLLNDFDAMLKEANNDVTSAYGRITLHVFREINTELLPNYCYNAATNRFVKTAFSLQKEAKRDKAPKIAACFVWGTKRLNHCFSNIYSLYSGFVGAPHFQAICRLLGYLGIAIVIEELLKEVKNIISGEAAQYVETLMNVMPETMKPPSFGCGSPGILGFYQAHIDDLVQYTDLRTEVFRTFTEIGNAVLFCLLMEKAVNQEEVFDLKHSGIFRNMLPDPYIPTLAGDKHNKSLAKKTKQLLLEKYENLHVCEVVAKGGTEEQSGIADDADVLTSERLCRGLSIFRIVLKRMTFFVNKPLWRGQPPSNGVMNVETCTEFHRLWSAIQFVFCIPIKETEFTVEEMFGEGLNWAGCTIIVLLGQQRRFELLDFCYHLHKMFRVDMKDENISGIQLKQMVDRIRKFQVLNNQIFSVLNNYMKQDEDDKMNNKLVRNFNPPSSEPHSTYF